MKAQEMLSNMLNEKILNGSERFNLIKVHGYKGVAETIKQDINQRDRVFVKGAVCERTVRYPIQFRCNGCGVASQQFIEYTRYEVVARGVRLDNQYIPNFSTIYEDNDNFQMA